MNRAQITKEVIELQKRLNRVLGQYTPEAWLELDLTVAQLKSLVFIAHQEDTKFKKLADVIGVTPANVIGIIDRLVEQGLVSREENPKDRRMLLLKTTETGKPS